MIEGSACPSCGRRAAPPEPRCLACGAETRSERVPALGLVIARTRTDPDADWIALVELDGGSRVLARADEQPRIGVEVELGAIEGGPRGVYRAT